MDDFRERGGAMKTITCGHCGEKFESPHYGPETCPTCKAIGHYDGSPHFCRVCKSATKGDE